MQSILDLTTYGYEIIEELGHNREGGRITWKGKKLQDNCLIVIKQFCFATSDSTWSGYKAYQQEINLLQKLSYRGIPRYIDSVETGNGFCLMQEYIEAVSLASLENISLDKIQFITVKLLEILVYLQEREHPIFHRDIKPENILVDQEFNPYLIDFGFGKIVEDENIASSVVQGTPGFIAPESAIALSKASDLYSLGVTIICLLTNKKSSEILAFANPDNPYQIDFKPLLPQLDQDFSNWLKKMIAPQVSKRFPNAITALQALKELSWDWELNSDNQSNKSILNINNVPNLNIEKISSNYVFPLGNFGMFILATTIVIGWQICDRVTQQSFSNIMMALIGIVIVFITQLAAAISINTDESNKKETIVIAIAVPIILVSIVGVIWGRGEAVAMTLSVVIAQGLTLGYVLLQKLSFQFKNNKFKAIGLFVAVLLGFLLGNMVAS